MVGKKRKREEQGDKRNGGGGGAACLFVDGLVGLVVEPDESVILSGVVWLGVFK
jgi:hypothetical protein